MKIIDERKWEWQGVKVGDIVSDGKEFYLIIQDEHKEEKLPIKVLRLWDATIVEAYRYVTQADLAYTLEAKAKQVEVHLKP